MATNLLMANIIQKTLTIQQTTTMMFTILSPIRIPPPPPPLQHEEPSPLLPDFVLLYILNYRLNQGGRFAELWVLSDNTRKHQQRFSQGIRGYLTNLTDWRTAQIYSNQSTRTFNPSFVYNEQVLRYWNGSCKKIMSTVPCTQHNILYIQCTV